MKLRKLGVQKGQGYTKRECTLVHQRCRKPRGTGKEGRRTWQASSTNWWELWQDQAVSDGRAIDAPDGGTGGLDAGQSFDQKLIQEDEEERLDREWEARRRLKVRRQVKASVARFQNSSK